MSNGKFLGIWVPFLVLSGAVIITVECVAPSYATILDTYAARIWSPLGKGEMIKTPAKGSENWDSNYYKQSFAKGEKGEGSKEANQNAESVVQKLLKKEWSF